MILLPGSSEQLLLLKCAFRYWLRHKWQAILMLVGMALGVAVVFSVDIANQSAKRAFALSLDAITGRATHQIVGGSNGVDEQIYTELRTGLGMRQSAPIIEGSIAIESTLPMASATKDKVPLENLQLLGVDIFAEPMFRNQLDTLQSASAANSSSKQQLALLQKNTVILGDSIARRIGINPGDTMPVRAGGQAHTLRLVNVVDTDIQPVFDTLAMVDIATAQTLLSMQGRLTRIDLVADNKEIVERIQQSFSDVSVVAAARKNNALKQMTTAFHTNLLAMSLLALLVGAFLIYNTVTLSVLQRRALFGQFRVMGVRRFSLAASVLLESLLFAVVGVTLGLLLGYLLGGLLLHLVTRTINDLYFVLDVRQLNVSGLSLLKAIALGIGATVLAVAAPAIDAANSPPVSLLQRSRVEAVTKTMLPVISVIGAVSMVCGLLVLWLSGTLWGAFAALFLIVIGYSLLIPMCLVWLVQRAQKIKMLSSGSMGHYPWRSLTASLSRTAVAVAALVVAVSATAGVGIMIGSFRLSVADWLENTLQADLYIRDNQSLENPLPKNLVPGLQELPAVAGLRIARFVDSNVQDVPVRIMALKFSGDVNRGLTFKETQANTMRVWESWEQANNVFVSEPLAWQQRLSVDDTLSMATDHGIKHFNVSGIFTDYGAGKGLVIMPMDTFHEYWTDRSISSVGIALDSNSEQVTEQVRFLVNEMPSLMMRSNRDIRELSMNIFDRTFSITHVLRLLTVGVAFVGILSALIALSLERRREFATLRALGLTPAQLKNLLLRQTGLMGIIAGVLALPLGIIMSAILVSVINLRSFGWTMQLHIPASVMIESLVLAGFAALLAGWYPARQLSRLSPSEALRNP